ncbi:uncharacterized protein MKK02DRAFT_28845 [Dioszegia hungarica]|uniref:Uncharacterized protein n=1 Tax=Dioszegia hungarica TaxID=4972 RepID=A0AA38LR94_9TREE|nr:uncharacterized protein MKK02DRAFT_28845 [Dioszegia hungarica]KAI9634167.1 hypothetical protein MKK02DRAFT_28845 [Dioszegia hungarica]
MVLPSQILPQHQTDPLVTLPLPSPLPPSPLPALSTLLAHFDTLLADPSGSKNVVPPMMIATAMRQINRDAHALLNAGRVGAAESRAELDRRDTVLRGVEYERNRIREEIERCLEYVPAYTGAELPDRQAFLESASEEVKSGLPNVGSEEYDYALIIAQLEEELKEIEEREVDVAALTKDRDSLIKAKKEIKLKFDLTETWLTDYARSVNLGPP